MMVFSAPKKSRTKGSATAPLRKCLGTTND
jgi:hypothetical protein